MALDPEVRAEGRRLLDAATPGPWGWIDPNPGEDWCHHGPDLVGPDHALVIESWGHDADGLHIGEPDARLIVWAVNNLAALLDAVPTEAEAERAARIEEAARALTSAIFDLDGTSDDACVDLAEALRAALAAPTTTEADR